MRPSPTSSLRPLFLSLALLTACSSGDAPVPAPTPSEKPAGQPVVENVLLQDVIETKPNLIIGISYPPPAMKHPALARALRDYAEAARNEVVRALTALGQAKPAAPYDLSLQFSMLVESPRIVAVAADGSSYTGGAHGQPLVERFVWLPQKQQMLAAEQLIPQADSWKPVSAYVREQLMTALSAQLDEEALEGAVRAEQLALRSKMITEGTEPGAARFARIEPVLNADGSIRALRFVFPPYQVAPYSEGTRSVEVPARLLLPLVADEYKALFRAA